MLNADAAKEELRKFTDRNFSDFIGDERMDTKDKAIKESIDGWAETLYKCCEAIVPASSTLVQAKAAFKTAAEGMYLDPTGAAFQAACAQFALVLGQGMVTPPNAGVPKYAVTPPPFPYIPASGGPIEDGAISAGIMATSLVAWLSTGTAVDLLTNIPQNWA